MLSEKPRSGLSETRKMTKSTMEKKRRARINTSLVELKTILSGMITHKGERFDKMEKADILELTVKCVRQLQKQANTAEPAHSPSIPADEDYRSGMHTCMSEVIKFISSSNFSDAGPEVKTKLLEHLANKLSSGAHKSSHDLDTPHTYQKCTLNENNVGVTKYGDGTVSSSDMPNDSNNNLQSINNKNGPYSPNVQQQKLSSPISPSNAPVFASYKPIQPMVDTSQQPTNVPTVPLTILVPANFCSTSLGTTCMIPLNLHTASPQVNQTNIIPALTPASQANFAFNSGSGISLISGQSFLPNTPSPFKSNAATSFFPECRSYTFTPTVISGNNQQPNQMLETSSSSKSASVSYPPIFHPQIDIKEANTSAINMHTVTDSTQSISPETPSNHHLFPLPNETVSSQISGSPGIFRHMAHRSENNDTQTASEKCSDTNLSYSVRQMCTSDSNEDRRLSEQTHLTGTNRTRYPEISQNRNVLYNPNATNGCDSSTDMWRPW